MKDYWIGRRADVAENERRFWTGRLIDERSREFDAAVGRLEKLIDVLIGVVPNEFCLSVRDDLNDPAIRSLPRYLTFGIVVDRDDHEHSGYMILEQEAAHLAANIVPDPYRDEVATLLIDTALDRKTMVFCVRQAEKARASLSLPEVAQ